MCSEAFRLAAVERFVSKLTQERVPHAFDLVPIKLGSALNTHTNSGRVCAQRSRSWWFGTRLNELIYSPGGACCYRDRSTVA